MAQDAASVGNIILLFEGNAVSSAARVKIKDKPFPALAISGGLHCVSGGLAVGEGSCTKYWGDNNLQNM